MAGPITWQNVNGPSIAEASRPLEAASRSFNSGFDVLQNVVKERQALDAANVGVRRENNTQQYLDRLSQMGRDPAALREAIASGAIDQMRSGYGPNIDAARVRGAAESLLDARYKQQAAADAFDVQTKLTAQKPIEDDIINTAYRDLPLAKKLLQENAGLYRAGELSKALSEIERGNTKFSWEAEDQRMQKEMQAASIANMAAQRGLQSRGLDIQERNFKLSQSDYYDRLEDKKEEKLGNLRKELGSLAGRQANSAEGTKAVFDALKDIKDEDARNVATRYAQEVIKMPGMTTGAAIAALMSQPTNNFHTWDSTYGIRIKDTAKNLVNAPDALKDAENMEMRRLRILEAEKRLLQRSNRNGGAGKKVTVSGYRDPDERE